jgi:chromosome segregation ATPase
MLTYAQLGEELGISPAGARMLAKRHRLPKITDNHGRAVVGIEAERLARLRDERSAERSSRGASERAVANVGANAGEQASAIAALQAHIDDLRAVAGAHQVERESLRRLLARFLEAREREIDSWETERRRLGDEIERRRAEGDRAAGEHAAERARWEAERRALNLRLDQFEEELAHATGQAPADEPRRSSWLVRVFRRDRGVAVARRGSPF